MGNYEQAAALDTLHVGDLTYNLVLPDEPQFERPADVVSQAYDIQESEGDRRLHDVFFRSRLGRKATALGLVAGLAAPAGVSTEAVAADDTGFQTTTTVEVHNASESASAVAEKRIIIGEDVRLKKGTNMKRCHWTKGAFTNSVRLATGRLKYYRDSQRGYLCANKNSPTGYVKVKGGETGRPCFNPARDHAPRPRPNEKVVNVRRLNVSFVLRAVAEANAEAVCTGANASGHARGEVTQRFNLKNYLKMRGSSQAGIYLKLEDKAKAKAIANAHCDSTTTITNQPNVPPPPPTRQQNRPPTVEILNVPAHVIDTDQQQICATESDPDGDNLSARWTAQLGNVSAPYHPNGNLDETCTTYTPPNVPTNSTERETVTVSVSDGQFTASASGSFDVVDDNIRPF